MPAVALDRASGIPLRRQMLQQLTAGIRRGEIPPGTRLPSTRLWARMLRLSRNTVANVFDELAAGGWIQCAPGSRARVLAPPGSQDGVRLPFRYLLRAAAYPIRTVAFCDREGNPLYLRDPEA